MTSTLRKLALGAILIGALVSAPTSATTLNPATSITAYDTFSSATVGTLLDQVSLPVATSSFSGTLTAAVYRGGSGFVDFYYQFASNVGTGTFDAVERITMALFADLGALITYATDVGIVDNAFGPFASAGTVAPTLIDRNGNGQVVGFDFDDQLTGISGFDPGETSRILAIRTDGHFYADGLVNIIDGNVFNGTAFAPVPLPAAVWLLGAGLAAFGFVSRRRKSE